MSERVVSREVKVDDFLAGGDAAAASGDWLCVARAWTEAAKLGSPQDANLVSLPALHSLADGFLRDEASVTAGLTLPWSSGSIEGAAPESSS